MVWSGWAHPALDRRRVVVRSSSGTLVVVVEYIQKSFEANSSPISRLGIFSMWWAYTVDLALFPFCLSLSKRLYMFALIIQVKALQQQQHYMYRRRYVSLFNPFDSNDDDPRIYAHTNHSVSFRLGGRALHSFFSAALCANNALKFPLCRRCI